jgi:hypothetical protein
MTNRDLRWCALLVLPTLGVASCATGKEGKPIPKDLKLVYAMPFASYKIQLAYTLETCPPPADPQNDSSGSRKKLREFGKLSAVAIPDIRADEATYSIDLERLESNLVDRSLTVAKNDNGTIKSINATADDRTFGIIGNIFKTIASIFGTAVSTGAVTPAGVAPTKTIACSPKADGLLKEAQELQAANFKDLGTIAARKDLKESEAGAFAAHATGVEKLIEMRGKRIASIQEALTRKGECTLEPKRTEASASCDIGLKIGELFKVGEADATDLKLSVAVARNSEPPNTLDKDPTRLIIRNVTRARMKLSAKAQGSWTAGDIDQNTLPELALPQWGDDVALPLDVGVSQKRTIALTFSPLGDVTSVTWATPARLERATADLAGVAEAAAGARTAVRYGDADAEIAELDREIAILEKRAKLKELKDKQAAAATPETIPEPAAMPK